VTEMSLRNSGGEAGRPTFACDSQGSFCSKHGTVLNCLNFPSNISCRRASVLCTLLRSLEHPYQDDETA
jgi:hypothetical protein